jgi:photosynthetic reaction center H subunit
MYLLTALFFALVYYLQRESMREGYPLVAELPRNERSRRVEGLTDHPDPKTFLLADGSKHVIAASGRPDTREIKAKPIASFPGAPLEPTGNPMIDGVGPGSWAERRDIPDAMHDGSPRILPLRVATQFSPESQDPDPRGMDVVGCDGKIAGVVRDLWIDKAEYMLRYLEVEVPTGAATHRVLLPEGFSSIGNGRVSVDAITAAQFRDVPGIRNPNQVTLLEEDKIMGYYGGGTLYATPTRQEPLF